MTVERSSAPSPVRDAMRIFNKFILNPVMVRLAGRRHWYAAVIIHTGRRSGTRYATPVVAERIADGFIIPLPYGTGVDWLRNVRKAGDARLRANGHSFDVVDPEMLDAASAAPYLSARRRRIFARFGVAHFVRFKLAPPIAA